MFHDYSNTKYTKLDTSTSTELENDENLPANFQFDSNIVVDKKEDFVNVFSDDLTRANISLSYDECNEEYEKKSEDSPNESNDFGDAECGEPATSQRLTIDFTMSNDDTEFSQKKCCDFWNLIYTTPHLKHLVVIPDPEETDVEQTGTIQDEPSKQSVSRASHTTPYAPGVDFLLNRTIADEPVATSFAAKQDSTCRNQSYLSYCHGSCAELDQDLMEKLKESKEKKKPLPAIQVQPTRKGFLTKLCSQMDAWDLKHPKSYDPPHHAPALMLAGEWSPSVQFSSSVSSPMELLCTSDMTCVPCTEKPFEVDLVKKEE